MLTATYWVGGLVMWPLVFRAAARRLLGIPVGRISGFVSGAVGIGIGSAASSRLPYGGENLAAYVFFGLAGTAGSVAALDFLARPATLAGLERSVAPPLHPVRALRRRIGRTSRYLEVTRIALRHRLLSRLAVPNTASVTAGDERLGRDLTRALQEAGGIFVKLGQVLSSRADLLPVAVTRQLVALQDRVSPAPIDTVDALLRAELGPLLEHFASFDRSPIAAASIGQVHRAQLRDGRQVVVKVQRPNIEERVERDLDIIVELARRVESSTSWGSRVGALALAHGFAASLREELDYRMEARNTKTLAELLGHRTKLRVPTVYEELSTRRVLVLEWLDGASLRDARELLEAAAVDRSSLGRELLEGFLEQVLEVGVFTTDPHPGNVLLLSDGTLAQIDFGSVGRLHRLQQLALARLVLAVDRGDPELLRGSLLDLAVASQSLDLDGLDRALTQFLAQRLGPGSHPGAELFTDLLALVTRFGLAFDPQLAGVFRALLTLEGTLRALDPEFVLVDEVRALASDVQHKTFGPATMRDAVSDDLLKLGPIVRNLPKRIDRIATAMERNEWGVNVRLLADERDTRFVTRLVDRGIVAFLSAAIGVISAILIIRSGASHATAPLALGYIGLAVATILGLRVLVAITRDGLV